MRVTIKQLRELIKEEATLSVEPDPFAGPGRRELSLPEVARAVIDAEDKLKSIPSMLNDIKDSTASKAAKKLCDRGAGLAYHALNDLKALEAVLMLAVRQAKKN